MLVGVVGKQERAQKATQRAKGPTRNVNKNQKHKTKKTSDGGCVTVRLSALMPWHTSITI